MRRRVEFLAIVTCVFIVGTVRAEAQTTKFGNWQVEATQEACVAMTPNASDFDETMVVFFNRELADAGVQPFLFFASKRNLKIPSNSVVFGYNDETLQVVAVNVEDAKNGELTIDPDVFSAKVLSFFLSKKSVSIATENELLFDYFSLKGFSKAYDAVKRCFE